MTGKPAVFLDRDGTLNREVDHLNRVQDLELLPGAGEAVVRLGEVGYPVLVITNQSAVARGLLTEAGLDHILTSMVSCDAETNDNEFKSLK